jgi:hypothetical protein
VLLCPNSKPDQTKKSNDAVGGISRSIGIEFPLAAILCVVKVIPQFHPPVAAGFSF